MSPRESRFFWLFIHVVRFFDFSDCLPIYVHISMKGIYSCDSSTTGYFNAICKIQSFLLWGQNFHVKRHKSFKQRENLLTGLNTDVTVTWLLPHLRAMSGLTWFLPVTSNLVSPAYVNFINTHMQTRILHSLSLLWNSSASISAEWEQSVVKVGP